MGYTESDTEVPDVKVFSAENGVKKLVDVKVDHDLKVEVGRDVKVDVDSKSITRISRKIKTEAKTEMKTDDQLVKSEAWEPHNWRDQLRAIQEMRKERDAPVDTMGCERCHDHDALPQIQRRVVFSTAS